MQFSKAKIKEIRSLMDERWNIEEKITQCKGLLTNCVRERKKKLKLNACQAQCPAKVLNSLERANNFKQKYLDLIRHKEQKHMEEFTNLKLEKEDLQDRLEVAFDSEKFHRTVQILSNKIQMIVVRQNTAPEVCERYQNMIKHLKYDAKYFDAVLARLQIDCEDRCETVSRVAEIRQVGEKELNDIREDYKRWEREVRLNTEEREREDQERMRRKAEELFLRCKVLMTAKPYTYVYKPKQKEQEELKQIMRQVQETMLPPTFYDVFRRMLRELDKEKTSLFTDREEATSHK